MLAFEIPERAASGPITAQRKSGTRDRYRKREEALVVEENGANWSDLFFDLTVLL